MNPPDANKKTGDPRVIVNVKVESPDGGDPTQIEVRINGYEFDSDTEAIDRVTLGYGIADIFATIFHLNVDVTIPD